MNFIFPWNKNKNDDSVFLSYDAHRNNLGDNSEIIIIDIQNKMPLKVVEEMLQFEKIVSSLLHGLIISDAYHISSVWIQFTKPIKADYFKFHDYFASVKRSVKKSFIFNEFKNLDNILQVFEDYEININLEDLKNSFSLLIKYLNFVKIKPEPIKSKLVINK